MMSSTRRMWRPWTGVLETIPSDTASCPVVVLPVYELARRKSMVRPAGSGSMLLTRSAVYLVGFGACGLRRSTRSFSDQGTLCSALLRVLQTQKLAALHFM